MRRFLGLVAFLLFTCIVATPAARPADEQQIKQAIQRGVDYLKGLQKENGSWPFSRLSDVGVADGGMTSLAGLALLECGVPTDDPVIQKAAAFVRRQSVIEVGTYSLALSIMFLDRFGETADVALVEAMAARLLAGQQVDGGWNYQSGRELVGAQEERLKQAVMRRADGKGDRRAPKIDERRSREDLSREGRGEIDNVLRRGAPPLPDGRNPSSWSQRTDNSNTQFAILGLWTARRYGVPVDDALKRVEVRFRKSQNADGGWTYNPTGAAGMMGKFNPGNQSTSAMTCAALLGLAMHNAAANESALRTSPKGQENKTKGGSGSKPPRDISEDADVARGLRYVAGALAASPLEKKDERTPDFRPPQGRGKPPAGAGPPQDDRPPKDGGKPPEGFQPPPGFKTPPGGNRIPGRIQPPGQVPGAKPGQGFPPGRGPFAPGMMPWISMNQSGKSYYFLWSLERMAVAFGLPTIGGKDWYDWGAGILLSNQANDGGWKGEYGDYGADTCFALLFLRRADLAKDLSASLKNKVKDTAELRADPNRFKGRDSIKPIKSPFDDVSGSSNDQAKSRPTEKRRTTERPRPAESTARVEPDVAKLSAELVDAPASKWTNALGKLRDGEGPTYTQALAHAITQLDGEPRKKAREALAERLSNMKPSTLLRYMQEDEPELRRASALAAAMKEDLTFVGKLIDLLNDPEKTVERAAHAALKELTKQKFGPAADATDAEKAEAIKAWKAWWQKQAEK